MPKRPHQDPYQVLYLPQADVGRAADFDATERTVREALNQPDARIRLPLLAQRMRSTTDLHAALAKAPHVQVLHLDGLGDPETGIRSADPDGRPVAMSGHGLARVLKTYPSVRLVILAADHQREHAQAISEVVPCVIAITDVADPDAMRSFVRFFYGELARGRLTVGKAFERAHAHAQVSHTVNVEMIHRSAVEPRWIWLTAAPAAAPTDEAHPALTHRFDGVDDAVLSIDLGRSWRAVIRHDPLAEPYVVTLETRADGRAPPPAKLRALLRRTANTLRASGRRRIHVVADVTPMTALLLSNALAALDRDRAREVIYYQKLASREPDGTWEPWGPGLSHLRVRASGEAFFAPLILPDSPIDRPCEVMLLVSTDSPMNAGAAMAASGASGVEVQTVHLAPNGLVLGSGRIDRAATQLRQAPEEIARCYPRAARIHLFFDGQVALLMRVASALGRSSIPISLYVPSDPPSRTSQFTRLMDLGAGSMAPVDEEGARRRPFRGMERSGDHPVRIGGALRASRGGAGRRTAAGGCLRKRTPGEGRCSDRGRTPGRRDGSGRASGPTAGLIDRIGFKSGERGDRAPICSAHAGPEARSALACRVSADAELRDFGDALGEGEGWQVVLHRASGKQAAGFDCQDSGGSLRWEGRDAAMHRQPMETNTEHTQAKTRAIAGLGGTGAAFQPKLHEGSATTEQKPSRARLSPRIPLLPDGWLTLSAVILALIWPGQGISKTTPGNTKPLRAEPEAIASTRSHGVNLIYKVQEKSHVRVEIFQLFESTTAEFVRIKVRTLERPNQPVSPGEHTLRWAGRNDAGTAVQNGRYIAVLMVRSDGDDGPFKEVAETEIGVNISDLFTKVVVTPTAYDPSAGDLIVRYTLGRPVKRLTTSVVGPDGTVRLIRVRNRPGTKDVWVDTWDGRMPVEQADPKQPPKYELAPPGRYTIRIRAYWKEELVRFRSSATQESFRMDEHVETIIVGTPIRFRGHSVVPNEIFPLWPGRPKVAELSFRVTQPVEASISVRRLEGGPELWRRTFAAKRGHNTVRWGAIKDAKRVTCDASLLTVVHVPKAERRNTKEGQDDVVEVSAGFSRHEHRYQYSKVFDARRKSDLFGSADYDHLGNPQIDHPYQVGEEIDTPPAVGEAIRQLWDTGNFARRSRVESVGECRVEDAQTFPNGDYLVTFEATDPRSRVHNPPRYSRVRIRGQKAFHLTCFIGYNDDCATQTGCRAFDGYASWTKAFPFLPKDTSFEGEAGVERLAVRCETSMDAKLTMSVRSLKDGRIVASSKPVDVLATKRRGGEPAYPFIASWSGAPKTIRVFDPKNPEALVEPTRKYIDDGHHEVVITAVELRSGRTIRSMQKILVAALPKLTLDASEKPASVRDKKLSNRVIEENDDLNNRSDAKIAGEVTEKTWLKAFLLERRDGDLEMTAVSGGPWDVFETSKTFEWTWDGSLPESAGKARYRDYKILFLYSARREDLDKAVARLQREAGDSAAHPPNWWQVRIGDAEKGLTVQHDTREIWTLGILSDLGKSLSDELGKSIEQTTLEALKWVD